jgi:hypothetical protein
MYYKYNLIKNFLLICFNYSKIKNIPNIVYKKFKTNSPRFNQNHSYIDDKYWPLIINAY